MRKLFYTIALIGMATLCICLSSCKSAQWHLIKFHEKGGKIECDVDTLKVIDTLIKDGDTTYLMRDSIIVKSQIEYVTKWETKYKYKTAKQEEKTKRKEISEDGKTDRKESNNDRKKEINASNNDRKVQNNFGKWVIFVITAFILGFFVRHFLPLIINVIKKI